MFVWSCSFSTLQQLKGHQSKEHESSLQKSVRCYVCEEVFSTNREMRVSLIFFYNWNFIDHFTTLGLKRAKFGQERATSYSEISSQFLHGQKKSRMNNHFQLTISFKSFGSLRAEYRKEKLLLCTLSAIVLVCRYTYGRSTSRTITTRRGRPSSVTTRSTRPRDSPYVSTKSQSFTWDLFPTQRDPRGSLYHRSPLCGTSWQINFLCQLLCQVIEINSNIQYILLHHRATTSPSLPNV